VSGRRTALQAATEALARRDHSTAELAAYLAKRGASVDDAARAIGRLTELGYLDDAGFAARRAEVLGERGYGDAGIRFDLERRGLTEEVIEAALSLLDPEAVRARALLERRGAASATGRRLAAKGFSAEAIEAALVMRPGETLD
jgi:regulatory protein